MADEEIVDVLDEGVVDFHRLESSGDEDAGDDAGVADEGRAHGDADGDSTPPSAAEQDVWAGVDPELVSLAQEKKWESPEAAMRAYRGLEELYGRQNTEREEQARRYEQERQQLLELVKGQQQQPVEEKPEPEAALVDQIDWESFGEYTESVSGKDFELFTRAILPLLQQEAERKILGEVAPQLAPLKEFTEQQQRAAAFDSEVQQIASRNPEVWELTGEATIGILRAWEDSGVTLEPGHVRLAHAEAMLDAFPVGQAPAVQDAAPVQQPAVTQQPEQPVGPQVGAADLQPLASTTVSQEPMDVNEQWRRAIEESEPTIDGTDL